MRIFVAGASGVIGKRVAVRDEVVGQRYLGGP